MAWIVWGEILTTTDLNGTSTRVAQKVIFNKDLIVKACRAWFIVYNNPTFTTLGFKIYSDNNNSPGALLLTTTTRTKAEIINLSNGVKEVYFELNDYAFQSSDVYWFVPFVTGAYVGNDTQHLSWKKAWPDPVYRTNVDSDFEKLAVAPYDIYFIGSEL